MGFVAIFIASCYYDNFEEVYPGAGLTNTCDTAGTMTYNLNAKKIFDENCGTSQSGCHSANSSSGYNLSDYAGSVATANTGLLLGSIRHENGYSAMPKNLPKMNDCNIVVIEKWVSQGLLQ